MASRNGLRSLGVSMAFGLLHAPMSWGAPVVLPDVPPEAMGGTEYQSLEQTAPDAPVQDSPFQVGIPDRPALKGMGGAQITVLGFQITGNTIFSNDTLLSLINDQLDRSMTLHELKVVADRVTRYYRQHGYFLTYAYIPVQEITTGVVEIAVIEGRIGKIQFNRNNEYWLTQNMVNGYLSRMRETSVANLDALERDMLLLNDLPGIGAVATLHPGEQVGTTDVRVTLRDTPVATGSLDFNNYGSKYNGEFRFGGMLEVNNPLSYGDRIKLRPLITANGETRYGSASYSFPVGYWGTRVGARYSKMLTNVGQDFEAIGLENHVQVSELFITHPFIRTNRLNLIGQVDYTHNEIKEVWRSVNIERLDEYSVFSVSMVADGYDNLLGGGTNQASVGLHVVTEKLADKDTTLGSANTAFNKFTLRFSRNQSLSREDKLNLFMKLNAQVSGAELVAAERFSLGGPDAVRAYPSGEALSDTGYVASFELRWNIFADFQTSMADSIQIYPFVDAGGGSKNDIAKTTYERSAIGIGVRVGRTGSYLIDLSAAQTASGDEAKSEEGVKEKYWVRVVKWF